MNIIIIDLNDSMKTFLKTTAISSELYFQLLSNMCHNDIIVHNCELFQFIHKLLSKVS